jgi:SET domain-containing protein
MLRVPTFVAPSPVAGVGLYAATDLPAGTVIWEYTEGVDWRIAPEEFARFPEPYRSRLRHYVYEEDSGVFVLCGDNAKFMNHSDRPNCDDPEGAYTVTNRVVRAGEELTCDYRSFDRDSRMHGMEFHRASGEGNGVARTA